MKLDKAKGRDKKRRKARHGMKIRGRSIFTIVEAQIGRAKKNKKGAKRNEDQS